MLNILTELLYYISVLIIITIIIPMLQLPSYGQLIYTLVVFYLVFGRDIFCGRIQIIIEKSRALMTKDDLKKTIDKIKKEDK